MNRSPLFLILVLFIGCTTHTQTQPQHTEAQAVEADQKIQPTLTQLWVTDTLLRTPESVLYDPEREILYVANVNMNPWEKDGNGFISKLDLEGNILELEWVKGLSGPKGMGIKGNALLVADIDEVVEIDIETGEILTRYGVKGIPTLNDISVYKDEVYISGSDSNKIFALQGDSIAIVKEGELGRPNGLFAEANRLLMITSNSSQLVSIDKESMSETVLVDNLGHGDGIVPIGNGDYLASSWRGELFYIYANMERAQLLDTRASETNAADIEYVQAKNMVLVPTFFKNQVVAYQLIL